MMDSVELIDFFLARWSKREIVSVGEVSDVLLDLRALAVAESTREETPAEVPASS